MKQIGKDKKEKMEGFGKCPDCIWYHVEEGCNVQRDSKICRLNRKESKDGNS